MILQAKAYAPVPKGSRAFLFIKAACKSFYELVMKNY